MILAETDAKTKQCRVAGPALSANRLEVNGGQKIGFFSCAGSLCCHWRWADRTSGYCGLAGKPGE